MFEVHRITLAAVLLGRTPSAYAAAGCHPAYDTAATYSSGDTVSASTLSDTITTETCTPPGVGTCPASGSRAITAKTTKMYNYACKNGSLGLFCGQEGYAPGTLYSGHAWTRESEECSVSVFFLSRRVSAVGDRASGVVDRNHAHALLTVMFNSNACTWLCSMPFDL